MAVQGSYNSVGAYIPFPGQPFRTWNRFPYVCNLIEDRDKKRKYYVLKNPPNTTVADAPVKVSDPSKLKTIERFGKIYVIDPPIYDALVQSLQASDVANFQQLQDRIKLIRTNLNLPGSLKSQLNDVALLGIKRQYTYPTAGDKLGSTPDINATRTNAGSDFKISGNVDFVSGVLPIIAYYENTFFAGSKYKFRSENGQFIAVQSNEFCSYVRTTAELTTTASRAGLSILALPNAPTVPNLGFIVGDTYFKPVMAYMVPFSNTSRGYIYPPKIGVLFGLPYAFLLNLIQYLLSPFPLPLPPYFDQWTIANLTTLLDIVQTNGELFFVPLQTEEQYIAHIDYPVNMGVYFQFTNGGMFGDSYYNELFDGVRDKLKLF